MSCIRVCDLCGLPLPLDDGGKKYIIKERKQSFWKAEWIEIDAHERCVKQLLTEAKSRKAGEGEV